MKYHEDGVDGVSLAGEGVGELAVSGRGDGEGVSSAGESVPEGDVDGPSSSSSAMISERIISSPLLPRQTRTINTTHLLHKPPDAP